MVNIIKTVALDHDDEEHVRPALFIDEKLLDYVYIWSCTHADYDTASTYISHLYRFVNYLLNRTKRPFTEDRAFDFWTMVTNDDIKAWQRARMRDNQLNRKAANYHTVKKEAHTVVRFLHWVHGQGVSMLFNPITKTILERSQAEDDLLTGINTEAKEKKIVDYIDVDIPETIVERVEDDGDIDEEDLIIYIDDALSNDFGWLPIDQFTKVIDMFPDPVYKAMSCAGLHTGLRNFELMGIPTVTPGRTFVCNPRELREKLRNNETELSLKIPKGKGDSARTIPIDTETWLEIMSYWWPIREERKRRLKDKHGIDLRIDQLWISKSLVPLYCDPQNDSTHKKAKDALGKAFYWISLNENNPNRSAALYSFKANYYKLRHTYATLYVYEIMAEKNDFDGGHWVTNMWLRNDLMKRMGHKVLKTTFEHYVECAVLLHTNKEGRKAFYPGKDYLQHLKNVAKSQK